MGIKEFTPWLTEAEKASGEGLSKPTNLSEAEALFAKSSSFDNNCVAHLKLLNAANDAAQRMTTHKEADVEVAALKERYNKVKSVSDEWRAKVETLVKEWKLLDNTVTELNAWVAKTRQLREKTSSLLRKWSPHLVNLKIFSSRRRSLLKICKLCMMKNTNKLRNPM